MKILEFHQDIEKIFSNNPWDYHYSLSGFYGLGKQINFDERGNIKNIKNYTDFGCGKCISWWSNGNTCSIYEEIDYKKNGLFLWWSSDQKNIEVSYIKDDQLSGEFKYYINGNLISHMYYINGVIIANFINDPELKKDYKLKDDYILDEEGKYHKYDIKYRNIKKNVS